MNYRMWLYFFLFSLRGQSLGKHYHEYLNEYNIGISPDIQKKLLTRLLTHCEHHVPYYANIIKRLGTQFYDHPYEYLAQFPILTKDTVRYHFDELKSTDLNQRKWYLNSTGGSTGEAVQFIQDREYSARSGAVSLLFAKLIGKEIGEREVTLWGSHRDIARSRENWRAQLITIIINTNLINTILMNPQRMREFIHTINVSKPKLIVAYADTMYALAKFAESSGLPIIPQRAIVTSAAKLYPFMRSKIEEVFHCRVYDRYGSREVGDIACERPGFDGLWVAPWGNYLEIVDQDGNRLPDGTEGEILVTSLTNYAMPLIRYKIGDRGILTANDYDKNTSGQVLSDVTGRTIDFFKTENGALINSGFFMANLYFRDWITRYQIIQKSQLSVIYRIVKSYDPPENEYDEIVEITRKAMGAGCEVTFEFVEEISPSSSGKYRFLVSEVTEESLSVD